MIVEMMKETGNVNEKAKRWKKKESRIMDVVGIGSAQEVTST